MLASNGETIVTEQLQAIANDIHAIKVYVAFACGVIVFIGVGVWSKK
mgnify:CR=1 FL=1